MTEKEKLLDFKEKLAEKGQLLSRPKLNRLIELLNNELDALKNQEGYETDSK